MPERLKDHEHLLRMLALLLLGIAAFLVLRSFAVPKDYGRYGPFRAGALDDNAAQPVAFGGQAVCEECHGDVIESRQGSRHAGISCEICHGPAAAHAEDPSSSQPVRPDGRELCLNCHSVNVARPEAFPQIDPAAHGDEGLCTACHPHHHPEL